MYKGVGICFADFISFFSNIPWKLNNLVSLRPNYSILIGYLKTGRWEGCSIESLEPPLLLFKIINLKTHPVIFSPQNTIKKDVTFRLGLHCLPNNPFWEFRSTKC